MRGYEALEFDGAAGRVPPLRRGDDAAAGIHSARRHPGRAVRHTVRRSDGVRRAARWPDRCRVHPHRGTFHQHPARLWPDLDSGEQPRSDDWFGGRIGGGRSYFHPARVDLPGLSAGVLTHLPAGADWRLSGRIVYDSSAPPAHRQGTRQPALPGGHRLRRRAGGGREGRIICRARLLGPWSGRGLHFLYDHAGPVARPARPPAEMAAGRIIPGRDHVGVPRRGLHHWPARGRYDFRRRRFVLVGVDAGDQILRPARAGTRLPKHRAHPGHDALPTLGQLHPADGRRRGGCLRAHHADEDHADNSCRASLGTQGHPRPERRQRGGHQPHRARPSHEAGRAWLARDCGHDVGLADV